MEDHDTANLIEAAWRAASDTRTEISPRYGDEELAFCITLVVGKDRSDLAIEGNETTLTSLREGFRAYSHRTFCPDVVTSTDTVEIGQDIQDEGRQFYYNVQAYSEERKFFKTAEGRYGIGPPVMKQGVLCCLILGAVVPFIVRSTRQTFITSWLVNAIYMALCEVKLWMTGGRVY